MDLMHVHGMYYLRILGSQKGKKKRALKCLLLFQTR